MAKNIRKLLAMVMVMSMLVSALPVQALAAEDDTVITETETTVEGGLTTNTTTTTTITDGTPTVSVENKESITTGSPAEGAVIERVENSTSTTIIFKDENGNVVKEELIHSKQESNTELTFNGQNVTSVQNFYTGSEYNKVDMTLPTEGVTVVVPSISEDDPETEIKENESSATFTDESGTVTIEGDVKEGDRDPYYDYTSTTIKEQGKVTITTNKVEINESVDNDNTDMEYVKNEVTPDGENDLLYVSPAPEQYLPGYTEPTEEATEATEEASEPTEETTEATEEATDPTEETTSDYSYTYVGTGNTSKYVPAIVFNTPLSDADKVAQYGENAYIKKNSITYYFVGCLTEEDRARIAKDENGNYVLDENGYILDIDGNRILKEELTTKGPNGETLYLHRFDNTGDGHKVEGWFEDGEWVKELNGSDKYTAVWAGPQQFVLVDTNGNIITTYCADFNTPTQDSFQYNMENLEDATYYTDEEAEKIRAIALNGYWGTLGTKTNENGETVFLKDAEGNLVTDAEGKPIAEAVDGSLEAMKQQLLLSGEFTAEELASLNDGVALTATQMAIWSCSNKMTGLEFINAHYSNWGTGNVPTEKEDEVKMLFKLYDYLTNLDPVELQGTTADTIINNDNFVSDLAVTVMNKKPGEAKNEDYLEDNDVYYAKVSFSMEVLPNVTADDLVACLTDGQGNVIATGRIAGERQEGEIDMTGVTDGNYTFDEVVMTEGTQEFNLTLTGTQQLDKSVYLFTSEVDEDNTSSQTMVGVASGDRGVDVSMKIEFDLNVEGSMFTEHFWHEDGDPSFSFPTTEPTTEPTEPSEPSEPTIPTVPETPDVPNNPEPPVPANEEPPTNTFRVNNNNGEVEEIPEEPVPLAAPVVTGDNSALWIAMVIVSIFAMAYVNLFDKKRNTF